MKKLMKTASLVASVLMSVIMAPVPVAQAADDVRESTAKACLASSTQQASGAVSEETVSRESETHASPYGYCTVDCSPCWLKSTECQKRGAGACTSIPACRQTPQP